MTGTAKQMFDELLAKLSVSRMYDVVLPLPEDFAFGGHIPYDMTIVDGIATIKIPAASREEAIANGKKFLGIGE